VVVLLLLLSRQAAYTCYTEMLHCVHYIHVCRYKLPAVCDDGLSPLIHARPGKSSGNIAPVLRGKWGVLEAATDKVFQTVAGVAVTLVDGSNGGRRLFVPDPETGRGVQKRGAFIGYVAVSKPEGEAKEVDVAIVWRGTIFKEEWESNFAQDKLVSSSTWRCSPDQFQQHRNVDILLLQWCIL
jgi:hypothetical protein